MLGTAVPKAKIWGCTSCWGEPVASIQSADKHTYFPVKKTDAEKLADAENSITELQIALVELCESVGV